MGTGNFHWGEAPWREVYYLAQWWKCLWHSCASGRCCPHRVGALKSNFFGPQVPMCRFWKQNVEEKKRQLCQRLQEQAEWAANEQAYCGTHWFDLSFSHCLLKTRTHLDLSCLKSLIWHSSFHKKNICSEPTYSLVFLPEQLLLSRMKLNEETCLIILKKSCWKRE